MVELRADKPNAFILLWKMFLAIELEIIFSDIPEIYSISKKILNPHCNHLRGSFETAIN